MSGYDEKLRASHFKVTPKRKAIIDCFVRKNCHLTADEIWNSLKRKFGQFGLPSVYRNLETLCACGILTKIQKFDRKRHYGLCRDSHARNHHHHHIVCVKCGKVADTEGCVLPSKDKISGFKIISHFLQFEGICPSCETK